MNSLPFTKFWQVALYKQHMRMGFQSSVLQVNERIHTLRDLVASLLWILVAEM